MRRGGMDMRRMERRMYRVRKRRRVIASVIVVALAAGVLLLRGSGDDFSALHLPQPTVTPVTSDFDRTVETREITLPTQTLYALQTGIFSSAEAAEGKKDEYSDRGAPGFVVRDGDKWRVFIACYDQKEDAAAVRDRLASQQVETYLYTWTCKEIALRLSGMAGQLDVAQAGCTLLSQAPMRLCQEVALLEAGQYTPEEAVQQVDHLAQEMALWAQTAKDRFGAKVPEMIAQLLTRAEAWQQAAKKINAAAGEGTRALCAEMKSQAISFFAGEAAFRIWLEQM